METETLSADPAKVSDENSNAESVNKTWDPGIRPREWIGVLVVVVFAVLPDLRNAIASYELVKSGAMIPSMEFADVMYYLIGRSFFVCAITLAAILFLGCQWKATGLKLIRFRDLSWGLAIYLAGTFVYLATRFVIPDHWFFMPELGDVLPAPTPDQYTLLLAGSIANGMGEELVVRGYLISRLEALTGSTWFAALATSSMFASYHLYQGAESMIGIFFLGLVYGFGFIKLRSIWPVFIAHALADIFGFLAL